MSLLKSRDGRKPDEIVLVGRAPWIRGIWALARSDDGAGCGHRDGRGEIDFANLPQRPRRTIRVVLYGSEEIGLVGGKSYAESHKSELSH